MDETDVDAACQQDELQADPDLKAPYCQKTTVEDMPGCQSFLGASHSY